jgi:hypothetical protein
LSTEIPEAESSERAQSPVLDSVEPFSDVQSPERRVTRCERHEGLARCQQQGSKTLHRRVISPMFVSPARWATIAKRIESKCPRQRRAMGCRMVNEW